jgi:hypothetical protein
VVNDELIWGESCRRAAEQRDELAAFQMTELHLISHCQGRIAGYRTGGE